MFEQLIGAAVGGLLGGQDQQQTAQREPWAPAQPWLKANIQQGQALQDFYTRNPFSPLQQQAYRNQFANLDNFQTGVAPGLLSIVNKYMPQGQQMRLAQNPRLGGLLNFNQMNPYLVAKIPPITKLLEDEDKKKQDTGDVDLLADWGRGGGGA